MNKLTWLDYTIMNNPNGVMLVLAKYGYVGWLAPQDFGELKDVALMLMQKYGDKATEDLLRVHPDYDVIRELPTEPTFQNFTGNILLDKNKRRLIILGGLLILAFLILK
jgi:hypothetical protein